MELTHTSVRLVLQAILLVLLFVKMNFLLLGVLLVFQSYIGIIEAVPYQSYPPDAVDKLAAEGLIKLAAYQAAHNPKSTCTIKNAIKRREW